jgi:hypothetical protein
MSFAERPILLQAYQLLELSPDASVEEIDAAYSRQVMEAIRQGRKEDKLHLKQAYEQLKNHTLQQSYDQAQTEEQQTVQHSIDQFLSHQLPHQTIQVDVKQFDRSIQIFLRSPQPLSQELAIAVRELIRSSELPDLQAIAIYGIRGERAIAWKSEFNLSNLNPIDPSDTDVYSFQNRYIIAYAFPVALGIAWLLNVTPFKYLLFGARIWVHEFGHATVAWLAGRQATPLPFGWTNVGEVRSLFVYFGLLILFGLFCYRGWQESKKWVMGVAIALALLQFYMTWFISIETYEMWLSFGGIGGEFYLSAFLIISFYFPLPEKWRWDFWRYPTLLLASFTFWSSLWQWQDIKKGASDIPWGTMFGGEGDAGGDMNRLSLDYGWSDQQIMGTYTTLGHLCVGVMFGVYAFCLLKRNPQVFAGIKAYFG